MKLKLLIGINLIILTTIVQSQVQDITIEHTVQPGESIHSITKKYLNTDILWKENWKLNPSIENPNLLSIGQTITVIKQRIIPAEKATMFDIINNVEKKLIAGDWLTAKTGDELQQKEGVRTLGKSSTTLQFNKTSTLKLLEHSQIFLQSRSTSISGTDSSTIEIIEGDAELNWEPLQVKNAEIEIISGQTRLTPSIGKTTSIRTGISDNGNSVISVYNGKSNVESAGLNIVVPKGMGVSVKQGQKPPEPKPLLKKPMLVSLNELNFNYTNPLIEWREVDGANSYLLELCEDQKCDKVILQKRTQNHRIQIEGINQVGNYYWRVAAISKDDIVGYKSKINTIIFSTNNADEEGPYIAINPTTKQIQSNNKIITAPNSKIQLICIDEQSGLESLYYKWNQGNLEKAENNFLLVDIKVGQLTIKAIDKLGNESLKTYNIEYL